MKKYRRNKETLAIQFDGDNLGELNSFCERFDTGPINKTKYFVK